MAMRGLDRQISLGLLDDVDCDDGVLLRALKSDDDGLLIRQQGLNDDCDGVLPTIHDGLYLHYDDHQLLEHASKNDDDFRFALVDCHDGLQLQVDDSFDSKLPVVVPIWISGEVQDF